MEELRSTEILAREIEAEASKKAEKILERAEREAKKILTDLEERIKKDVQEKAQFYEKRLEQLEKNAGSYVPLEKERFLVSFYYERVCQAMNDYFKAAGKEKRLSLLKDKLDECGSALKEKKLKVSYFGGLEEKDVISMIKGCSAVSYEDVIEFMEIPFEESGEERENANLIHEGMIIESEDNSVKLRLTMDEVIREIKDKYSYGLALALFGGRLPQ
jgi:V/A-type H+-transporting ATPase subunit E